MSERPNWLMGIRIPPGKLEEVVLYAHSIGASLIDIAPEFREQIEALTEALPSAPAMNGTHAPQIADQSKPARKGRAATGDELKGTCKGFILKYLRRRPRHPRELRQLATEKEVTWDIKGIDARLSELKQKGLVLITQHGWDLTDEGRAYSKHALVSSNEVRNKKAGRVPRTGKTHVDLAEEILKEVYPSFVLLGHVRAEFKRQKLRPNSASTALHRMKSRGRCVAGAEPATYQWIPLDQRA